MENNSGSRENGLDTKSVPETRNVRVGVFLHVSILKVKRRNFSFRGEKIENQVD